MKNYAVGIIIYNTFYVEAESEEEAEQKVRELSIESTLRDCDFNIEYVDEYKAGEECWKIKANEVDWTKLCDEHNNYLDKRIDDLYGNDPTYETK